MDVLFEETGSKDQAAAQRSNRRVEQLLALNKAAIAITGELELDALLQRIVDAARELVQCKYSALGVLGDDGYIVRFPTSGISQTEREQIGAPPRGHGLLGVMLRAGRSLRIPDMSKDPRGVGFPPNHPPMTSLLGVPILVRGKLVGDLYLTDKISGPEFAEEDEWIVQLLATHAATALTNSELHAEKTEALQRLRELDVMKDEFLSTAAHELRTPLTTIRMSAGLAHEQMKALAAQGNLDPRLVDLVGLVLDGSIRMHALVNDLLDLTRLEQGRATLSIDDVDLRDVVRASVEATKALFENKGQQLAVHLPEVQCWVRGDAARLEQIVINLLTNAHKYTPEGSRTEVRAVRAGSECRVLVRDNGPGILAEEADLIFDRFYRSKQHRQDRTPSTGLGLPIAKTIAELHRGRIWEEPAPGGGGLFVLTLPAASPSEN